MEMRLGMLEQENRGLRKQLETMGRPLRVKKVVYHVHALHIEEMSGTLNIGITAPLDEKDMERIELDLKKEEKC
jgi:hypothetical protein